MTDLPRSSSLRSSAAKAKRAARLNAGESSSPFSKPSVQYSNLTFAIDDETERQIEEERSKVRDTLESKK
jgi:hypothetical protein